MNDIVLYFYGTVKLLVANIEVNVLDYLTDNFKENYEFNFFLTVRYLILHIYIYIYVTDRLCLPDINFTLL